MSTAPVPKTSSWRLLALLLVAAMTAGGVWWWLKSPAPIDMTRVLALNNQGIGQLEQFEYKDAAETFEQVAKLAPDWLPGKVNLGIALLNWDGQATEEKKKDGDAPKKSTKALGSMDRAIQIFDKILRDDPANNHAAFCLGIINEYRGNLKEAIPLFAAVTARDPADAFAWYHLGFLHSQVQNLEPAKTALRKAIELDPYLASASYGLGMAIRLDDPKQAKEFLAKHGQLVRDGSNWETLSRLRYGEMGKYAEAVGRATPMNTSAVGPVPLFQRDEKLQVTLAPGTRWAKAADFGTGPEAELLRAVRSRFGGVLVTLDFNKDGKPDLFLAAAVVRDGHVQDLLLQNDGDGRYRDVTQETNLAGPRRTLGAFVADVDNDGFPDLLLTGAGKQRLFRNAAGKSPRFDEVSEKAGLDLGAQVCLGAAFVDIDQDSDLDLFLTILGRTTDEALAHLRDPNKAAGDGVALFLSVGVSPPSKDGKPLPLELKFKNASDKLPAGIGPVMNLAISDVDADRDVDVLTLSDGRLAQAILNDRFLNFRRQPIPESMLPKGTWNGALVLDANRDEKADLLVVGPGQKPVFLVQNTSGGEKWFTPGATDSPPLLQAQSVDIDLDGWTDVVGLGANHKPVLLHNDGARLKHVPQALGSDGEWPADLVAILAVDENGDGFPDFFVWSEADGLRLHRSQGNGNYPLILELTGRYDNAYTLRCNRDAVGAWAVAQTPHLRATAELSTFSAGLGQSRQPLVLGLAKSPQADFLSLRWPDGIWQAELNLPSRQRTVVTENNRKPISCPVLFAWNGRTFGFVNDFLGAGSLGECLLEGGHRQPRPEESVKIDARQLIAKDGRYVLKFAEPMDEATYLDRLQLVVVDHPIDMHVHPDERFIGDPKGPPQDLLAIRGKQRIFPVKATDHRGRDVTAALREADRVTADGFALRSWIGYAEEHFVELDFGDQLKAFGPGDTLGLFLVGWTDYPFPESIWAATQAGIALQGPILERLGPDGKWLPILDELGFPAGLTRMMVNDVTGKLHGGSCKLRIRTNMHVYWDQIYLAYVAERFPVDAKAESARGITVTRLEVLDAQLELRGVMQEFSPDGRLPTIYDHDRIDRVAVTRLQGMLTKTGDVTELLRERDDRFVVFGPGDEVTVRFDATKLPPLPDGWTRGFVLRTWGYCKDASPFTATGGTVGPLPFRAMSRFPYGSDEHYPRTPPHDDYLRRYQTRPVGR